MSKPFFTYMLHCADGSYYVGHTDDLPRRVSEDQNGGYCIYTSKRRPVRLVWNQEFGTREQAKEGEGRLKNWSRAKKIALASGDTAALRQAARKDFTNAGRAPRNG